MIIVVLRPHPQNAKQREEGRGSNESIQSLFSVLTRGTFDR